MRFVDSLKAHDTNLDRALGLVSWLVDWVSV